MSNFHWATVTGWMLAAAGPFYRAFGRELAVSAWNYLTSRKEPIMAFDLNAIKTGIGSLTTVVGEAVALEAESATGAPIEQVIADGVSALGAELAKNYPNSSFAKVLQSKPAVAALIAEGEATVKAVEAVTAALAT